MSLTARIGLVIGTGLLLNAGGAAEARLGGGFGGSHGMIAPHFAARAPARIDRSFGARRFGFGRRDLRPDRPFARNRRFGNGFGAGWGYWPDYGDDYWPDEAATPTTPDYGQPDDTGSADGGGPDLPAAGPSMGRTVIRHDFPSYTVFDYCRIPPRDLNDCGPEWIVMHPVAGNPPAATAR